MRTILALSMQKRDRQRVNVTLDGGEVFGLSTLLAAWLKVGDEVSEEKIRQLVDEDALEQGNRKAMAYMSRRPRTEAEVRNYLEKNGLGEEAIAEMLTRYRETGLLDDREFAASWVESRRHFRPRSRIGLRFELRRLGIADEIIRETLSALDENEMANDVAVRLARRFQGTTWQEFRTKICGRLVQQGFPYGIAEQAARRAWETDHDVDQYERILDENEEPIV